SIFILPLFAFAAPIDSLDEKAAIRELNGLSENAQNYIVIVIFFFVIMTVICTFTIFSIMESILSKINNFFTAAQEKMRSIFRKN
ncbi:hypothetical protein PENTCL1PPCAC_5137, partial [Pristionchus entomophagus]